MATPATTPITIPAMAPPDKDPPLPAPSPEEPAALDPDGDGDGDADAEGSLPLTTARKDRGWWCSATARHGQGLHVWPASAVPVQLLFSQK